MELTSDLRHPEDREENARPADPRAAEWAAWTAPDSKRSVLHSADLELIDRDPQDLSSPALGDWGPVVPNAALADAGPSVPVAGAGLLAARGDRLVEPYDAATERSLLWILGASLLAHLCLLLAFALLNPKQLEAERARETPVDVVVEQPPPKPPAKEESKQAPPLSTNTKQAEPKQPAPPPPEAKQPEAKPPEAKPPETKAPEAKPPEQKPPEEKPPEEKPPEQKPAAKPPETKTPEQKPPEQKTPPKPPEAKPNAAKPAQSTSAEKRASEQKASEQKASEQRAAKEARAAAAAAQKEARDRSAAEAAAGKAAAADASKTAADKFASTNPEGLDSKVGRQGGLRLPFDTEPDSFRAVAVPLPTEGGDEPMSYKEIVFGLLERSKQYPPAARARGARGAAVVSFTLDESGQLTNVTLVRSSGDTDLDVESLALVARAAPYPKPPPDAQRAFAAEITFGLDPSE